MRQFYRLYYKEDKEEYLDNFKAASFIDFYGFCRGFLCNAS